MTGPSSSPPERDVFDRDIIVVPAVERVAPAALPVNETAPKRKLSEKSDDEGRKVTFQGDSLVVKSKTPLVTRITSSSPSSSIPSSPATPSHRAVATPSPDRI